MKRRRFASRYHPPRRRRGFALVEVVIALVLLSCGALALVGATAMAVRSTSAAERQTAATRVARNRVEMLAAGACSVAVEQTAADSSDQWIHERWTVSPTQHATRLVVDSVRYVGPTGTRTLSLERLVVC